jgi:hypothetical protein
MYTSWSYIDANAQQHWGLDVVDNFSTAASTFSLQSLIYDGGVRYKTKNALRYKLSNLPLPANCTLQAIVSQDRGSFVASPTETTNQTSVVYETNNARFHEYQWGFQGTCAAGVTNPPTITGMTMEVDPLTDEIELRYDSD